MAIRHAAINKLKLGPTSLTKDIDTDEEIIALRKQLKELKDTIEKEKEEKKLAEEKKKTEEKKKAEEKRKINSMISK